jgi:hypothetical protein
MIVGSRVPSASMRLRTTFGRAVHRVVDRELESGPGLREDEPAAVDHFDRPVALAGEASAGGQRLDQTARGVDPARVLDHEREASAGGRHVADADPRLGAAQHRADRFLHRLEPLLGDLARIGLEHDVAAAGEVEPEVDHRAGQRVRQADPRQREQRRDRGEREHQRDRPQPESLPEREIEHRERACRVSRWPACRRAGRCHRWST